MVKFCTALLLIIAFYIIVKKKLDIRFTFLVFGIIFFLISKHPDYLLITFFNVKFLLLSVIAIMASFGFAEILKVEKYSIETVHLFANAIGEVKNTHRFMIIFVSMFATWIASLSLLSANAACSIVAPIFLPILMRFGINAKFAAVPLISGAWGAILNPGDVNAGIIRNTLKQYYNLNRIDIIEYNLLPAIVAIFCIVILLYFMYRKKIKKNEAGNLEHKPLSKFTLRATISFLPFFLLLIWALLPNEINDRFKVNYIVIASLLSGSFIAVLFAHYVSKINLVRHFCRGTWKGFIEVALLIITSKIFIEGFKFSFGENSISKWIIGLEHYQIPIAVIITFVFTILTGSGDAIVTSVIQVFIPSIGKSLAPMASCMVWFAGEIGRCASPVSAATITMSKIAGTDPNSIAKKAIIVVAIGLIGALITLLLIN